MISVASAAEARKAIGGGAILLDVKNPQEGSLGAQSPGVIREIKEMVSGRIEVSAAIGDMPNLPGTAALAALGAAVCGANYIKVGLYAQHSKPEAVVLMCAVRDAVAGYNTAVIAAGYADYHRVDALDPRSLLDVAKESAIQGCLIDTAIKDGNTLFDYLRAEELRAIAQQAHAAGILFAAAGALREEHLPTLMDAGVDIAGVRTAVCLENQRRGPLDPTRVRDLIEKYGKE